MGKVVYIVDDSTDIEIVSMENITIEYPPHTHTKHMIFCIVLDGAIIVTLNGEDYIFSRGSSFSVLPNVCHSLKPLEGKYTLKTICIPVLPQKNKSEFGEIKEEMLLFPEKKLKLDKVSKSVHISLYHLIRKFALENGITPHKFQLQCRIRKAQKLLISGESVIDVAQMVGFSDQSHLDRIFKKQLGISPSEYQKSAILYKE